MENHNLNELKQKMIGKTISGLNIYSDGDGIAIHFDGGECVLIKASYSYDFAELDIEAESDLDIREKLEAGLISQGAYEESCNKIQKENRLRKKERDLKEFNRLKDKLGIKDV